MNENRRVQMVWLLLVLVLVVLVGYLGLAAPTALSSAPVRQSGMESPPSVLERLLDAYRRGGLHRDDFAFYLAASVYAPDRLPEDLREARPGKDGTLALLMMRSLWPQLSDETRARILALQNPSPQEQARPQLSGEERKLLTEHFAIHYTLEGKDAVPADDKDNNGVVDYVEAVAEAAEYSWSVEVDQLGWTPPPPDRGEGGDERYDVYLRDIIYYGYTDPSGGRVGDNPNSADRREENAYYSFLVLDNDYVGFSGDPINLLKVTIAHEFNHALQFGYDGDDPALWLYEGVATWVEDEVYDDINDNRQYLSALLGKPELCLSFNNSFNDVHPYATWIFFRYLSEHVGGPSTVRAVWEQAVPFDNYAAVAHAVSLAGRTLPDVFADFSVAIALQRPCGANTSTDDPYCFEEAPFETETHREGYARWTGTPSSVQPRLGVQPFGANFWQIQQAITTPLNLQILLPSTGTYRVRLIRPGDQLQVLDASADGEDVSLLVPVAEGEVDTLALARVDMPSTESCDYTTYKVLFVPGENTPTPSPTPTVATPTVTPTPTPTPTPTITPTPTPSPTPTPVPLPPEQCSELVQNGDFEGELVDPWVESPGGIVFSQDVGAIAHSGTHSAWFGGYRNADDWLYQDITLPSDVDRLTLRYWAYVRSDALDKVRHTLRVTLRDTEDQVLEDVGLWHNLMPQSRWFLYERDLTAFRGRAVRLYFHGRTDNYAKWTNFYVDDVSIEACTRPPLVQNGGFEEGMAFWKHGGDQPVSVVTDTVHSGTQALLLGEPVTAVTQTTQAAWTAQVVVVPVQMAKPSLHLWYRMFTNDIIAYNRFRVQVWTPNGTSLLTTLLEDGYDENGNVAPPPGTDMGWKEAYLDMSAFAGKRVQVRFINENVHPGLSLGSWTYVDDIALMDAVARGTWKVWLPIALRGPLTGPALVPARSPAWGTLLRSKPVDPKEK